MTGLFLFVFWFSVRNSELSGEPPLPHVTRAHGPCHVATIACVPSISLGDIMPSLIAQVFHSLSELT